MTTVAAHLRLIAEAFEVGNGMAAAMGLTPDPNPSSDLRTWAVWLDEHPDVDQAMAALSSLAERREP